MYCCLCIVADVIVVAAAVDVDFHRSTDASTHDNGGLSISYFGQQKANRTDTVCLFDLCL